MSKLSVFICHSSSDKPAARELYARLRAEGFAPWLDEEDLLPGQQWRKEIPKVVANAHVVVVCLSQGSITKEGYVQKEIGYALDVAAEKPDDTIFIIPVRLEPCEVPGRLSELHWVDLYEARGYDRLLRALRKRKETLHLGPSEAAPSPSREGDSQSPTPVAPAEPSREPREKRKRKERGATADAGAGEDEGFGVALGFSLLWLNGNPFMVEIEVSSYVDDPQALGATLVFHPVDYSIIRAPTTIPEWRWDIDGDLERDEKAAIKEQFRSISVQLSRWSEERLCEYLLRAMGGG